MPLMGAGAALSSALVPGGRRVPGAPHGLLEQIFGRVPPGTMQIGGGAQPATGAPVDPMASPAPSAPMPMVGAPMTGGAMLGPAYGGIQGSILDLIRKRLTAAQPGQMQPTGSAPQSSAYNTWG